MNNSVIVEGEFTREVNPEWEKRLKGAKRKWESAKAEDIEPFLNFCREVHGFRESCGSVSGGSEFSNKGKEWLGVTHGQLSQWDAAGRRADELVSATNNLPLSEYSICRIASLDDVVFRKALPRLRQGMSQTEVRDLIRELNPPRKLTAKEQELKDIKKRERLYKAFKELPEKQQYILAQAIAGDAQARGWLK